MLLLKKAQVKCILLKEIVFFPSAFQNTFKPEIKTVSSNLLFCSMITKYFCIKFVKIIIWEEIWDIMLVLVFVRELPRARFNYFDPLEPVYLQITHFPTLAFPSSLCQSSEQQSIVIELTWYWIWIGNNSGLYS